MRLLVKSLAAAFAVVAVVFALANRAPVTVALSPLPVAFELPLYLLVLLALFVGVAIGGVSGWLAAGRRRRAERASRREAAALKREIDELKGAPPTESALPAPHGRA